MKRTHIKATKAQMQSYFAWLEGKTKGFPSFKIRFGHHVLELSFPTRELCEEYKISLQYVYVESDVRADGAIRFWNMALDEVLPPGVGHGANVIEYEGEAGFLRANRYGRWFGAYDMTTHIQYVCFDGRDLREYSPTWHPFRREFHYFAQNNGYLYLHSAAVGVDGKGVLLSANGGNGKSTTALSALIEHMDYVSDDYLIIDTEEKRVYPLYSCGILNLDSLKMLPELKAHVIREVPGRPGRSIIDLLPYREQFVDGLEICALVCPRVIKGEEVKVPRVTLDEHKAGKMQMAVSSARQNGENQIKGSNFVYQVFDCVKEIPSYELILSKDTKKNAEALKKLIKGEMKDV